jgi:hypothetical protein
MSNSNPIYQYPSVTISQNHPDPRNVILDNEYQHLQNNYEANLINHSDHTSGDTNNTININAYQEQYTPPQMHP